MTVPKRHHLLPEFYLRGFCNQALHEAEDHKSNPSRCRVWIYDRTQDQYRERGVKNVAVERHFYSADTLEGGRDAEPERQLSVLEGKAARIIRSLRPGCGLTSLQRAWLARFVAVMRFRTPTFRTGAESFADQKMPEIKQGLFPTVDSLRDFLRSKGVAVDELPDEEFERTYRDLQSETYDPPLTKNFLLMRMFALGEKAGGILSRFSWTFAWANERTSFVSSDDPFLVLDAEGEVVPAFTGHVGLASPGTTKVLPLTQRVCLLIGDGALQTRHVRLDRKTVRDFNLKQVEHYDRWLIARDQTLLKRLVEMR
jgi:Protein of unknown function (DUF4238)